MDWSRNPAPGTATAKTASARARTMCASSSRTTRTWPPTSSASCARNFFPSRPVRRRRPKRRPKRRSPRLADIDGSVDRGDREQLRESALRLLARREHSRVELVRKLTHKGWPEPLVEQVVDELAEMNLQS